MTKSGAFAQTKFIRPCLDFEPVDQKREAASLDIEKTDYT